MRRLTLAVLIVAGLSLPASAQDQALEQAISSALSEFESVLGKCGTATTIVSGETQLKLGVGADRSLIFVKPHGGNAKSVTTLHDAGSGNEVLSLTYEPGSPLPLPASSNPSFEPRSYKFTTKGEFGTFSAIDYQVATCPNGALIAFTASGGGGHFAGVTLAVYLGAGRLGKPVRVRDWLLID